MSALARLLDQRAHGHVRLRLGRDGVQELRETGSSKLRLPKGSSEAIVINTSGGLAGGDAVRIEAEAGDGASLTLTSQAAERIYRTLGPAAEVSISLRAGADAALFWMPQETILYEGSALTRRVDVDVPEKATFFAVESMVFGRTEMGEQVRHIDVVDRWHVRRAGRLIHAEAFRLGPHWPVSQAQFAGTRAAATVLLLSPDAEQRLDAVRDVLRTTGSASSWNGKLVARLLAQDGYALRKCLIQVMTACVGRNALPKTWTF